MGEGSQVREVEMGEAHCGFVVEPEAVGKSGYDCLDM